jgi:hypothetical protein
MFLKKQIVSAMAGVAMLALPVSSFAANYDYHHGHARAFAHNQALVNHSVPMAASRSANSYNYNHGQWTPPATWTSTPNRPWQQYAASNGWVPSNNWSYWHNHPYASNNGYVPPPTYQPYVAPVYSAPVYSYSAPNYSGNSMPGLLGLLGYSGYGQPAYSGNGVPVYAGVPGYSGNGLQSYPGDANNLNWLMQKRYDTMRTIAQLRAQGDSKGAARLVPVVTALNNRINSMR